MIKGTIFDIQRFAVHDGPGIRSTMFLKGCSARCGWCHNPESLSIKPQLQYYPDRCTGCGKCVMICPHVNDREACNACGLCAEECFSNARVIAGHELTADDAVNQLLEDKLYYENSGGGVTLSGGEPVLQTKFAEEVLKKLKENGINTAVQTAGFYPFALLERLLPHLDLVMYDIKAISSEIYGEHIHADGRLAIDNLMKLNAYDISVIVRTPCVHGINDSAEEIEGIASMLTNLKNLKYYMLIPYHSLGKVKYDILGEDFIPYTTPPESHIEMLENLASKYVPVYNYGRGDII